MAKLVTYEVITLDATTAVTTSSVGLNPPVTHIYVTVETQAVRYLPTGAPTASVGIPLPVGTTRLLFKDDLSLLKFIAQVNGAKLHVERMSGPV